MALEKQPFFLPLSQGIETKSDPKQLVPGKLVLLENGVFTSPNEIRKRYGYELLNQDVFSSITITYLNAIPESVVNGNFIADFKNELVLNDNLNLYSFSEGLDKWVYKGRNEVCAPSTFPVVRNSYAQTVPDSAVDPLTGLQIYAWEDSSTGNVRASVVDSLTGQIIQTNYEILPTGGGHTVRPKCALLKGKFVVFFEDTSTNVILRYVTYYNGAFSVATDLKTDVNTTYTMYDVVANTDINRVYVTYFNNSAVPQIFYINYLFQVSTSTALTTVLTTFNAITVGISTNAMADVNVFFCSPSTTVSRHFVLTADLTTLSSNPSTSVGTTCNQLTVIVDDTTFYLFSSIPGTADSEGRFSNAVTTVAMGIPGVTTFSDTLFRALGLSSKAFFVTKNGLKIPHVLCVFDSALQSTYFLCSLYNKIESSTRGVVVSKICESVSGGAPAKGSSLSAINTLSDNSKQTAVLKQDLLYTSASASGTTNTYTNSGVYSAIFDFAKTNPSITSLGENLHISSGYLTMYDGTNVVEHNFNYYPEAITAVVNTSGGNLTDSASYGYQWTYEWTDNQGQLHRSSPSPVLTKTTTATGSNVSQIVLTVPTYRVTSKTNVNIVGWRTVANGTVYYRLNLPSSPLANSLSSATVTYTDNASDASLLANEPLYTTGGEVPNTAAPAPKYLGVYQNRVLAIPAEEPNSIWYSKQVKPGSPVEFSNRFVKNITADDGGIVAAIEMDSNCILFKQNTIRYFSGSGPAPSGANDDFTPDQSIPTDVGCVDENSVVKTPIGLIFKSHKGIYLLDRSLAVSYIGDEVEAYNEFSVTSAELITYTTQIRFTLSNGTALVYDYYVKQWSVFANVSALSSVISDTDYVYMKSDGKVMAENRELFTDNGEFIKLKLQTGWLSLAGIQAFQRLYEMEILGQYFGPHQLQVQLAYDFNPVAVQTTPFNVTEMLNTNVYGGDPTYGQNSPYGGEYQRYQFRLFNERQTCESIQITIEDIGFAGYYVDTQGNTQKANYNQSYSISALSFLIGIKRGLNKLSANKSRG